MRIACVQLTSGLDVDDNMRHIGDAVRVAAASGADLVCLPEMAPRLSRGRAQAEAGAAPEAGHPVLAAFRALAADIGVCLHAGSMAIRPDAGVAETRLSNRSYLFGPDGAVLARYDKIHLFDVDLGGSEAYRESETYAPGARAVVADSPVGRIGMTVCYDLRFPVLYRDLALAGASVIAVPSAFTRPTGAAHWETLLRARAIETGCFVVAAAQTGQHACGRETFGHSLIVDPWGTVLADAGTKPGLVAADCDIAEVAAARRRIPALANARPYAAPAPDRIGYTQAH